MPMGHAVPIVAIRNATPIPIVRAVRVVVPMGHAVPIVAGHPVPPMKIATIVNNVQAGDVCQMTIKVCVPKTVLAAVQCVKVENV